MNLSHDTFDTPLGEFSVAFDAAGALVASAFGPVSALPPRLAPFHAIREIDSPRRDGDRPDVFHVIREKRPAHQVREQVRAYFAGERCQFTLRLAPRGTAFQLRVWSALREIEFGETRTYGVLAARLGDAAAARAVGRANATNPLCLFIPCHRVIGADGSMTGFAFGEQLKRDLLAHEATVSARYRAGLRTAAACG